MTEILGHIADNEADQKLSKKDFEKANRNDREKTVAELDKLKLIDEQEVIEAGYKELQKTYHEVYDTTKNEFLGIPNVLKDKTRAQASAPNGLNETQRNTIQHLYSGMRYKAKLEAMNKGKVDFFENATPESLEKGFYDTLQKIIANKKWDAFVDRVMGEKPAEVDPNKKTEDPNKKTEDPNKKTEDPNKKTEDPNKKTEDPNKKTEDPNKKTEDPNKKTEDPNKKAEDPNKKAEEDPKVDIPVINNPTTTDKPTNNKDNPINDKKIERRKERAEKRLEKLNGKLKDLETARTELLAKEKLLLEKQSELVSLQVAIQALTSDTDAALKGEYLSKQEELHKLIGNPNATDEKAKTGTLQNEIADLKDAIDYIENKEIPKSTDKLSGKYDKYISSMDKETKDFTESRKKAREKDKTDLDKQKPEQPTLSLDALNTLLSERDTLAKSLLTASSVEAKNKIFVLIAEKNKKIGEEQGKVNSGFKKYEEFTNKYNDKKQGYYTDVSNIIDKNLEVYSQGIEGIQKVIDSYERQIKTIEGQQTTNQQSVASANKEIQTLDTQIAAKNKEIESAGANNTLKNSLLSEKSKLINKKRIQQENINKSEKYAEVLEQNKQKITDQKNTMGESGFYKQMKDKVDQLNKDDKHVNAQLQKVGFQRDRNKLMVDTNDLQRDLDAQEQELRHLTTIKTSLEAKQEESGKKMGNGETPDEKKASQEFDEYTAELKKFNETNNLEEKQKKIDATNTSITEKRTQITNLDKGISDLQIPEVGGFVPMVPFEDYLVTPYEPNKSAEEIPEEENQEKIETNPKSEPEKTKEQSEDQVKTITSLNNALVFLESDNFDDARIQLEQAKKNSNLSPKALVSIELALSALGLDKPLAKREIQTALAEVKKTLTPETSEQINLLNPRNQETPLQPNSVKVPFNPDYKPNSVSRKIETISTNIETIITPEGQKLMDSLKLSLQKNDADGTVSIMKNGEKLGMKFDANTKSVNIMQSPVKNFTNGDLMIQIENKDGTREQHLIYSDEQNFKLVLNKYDTTQIQTLQQFLAQPKVKERPDNAYFMNAGFKKAFPGYNQTKLEDGYTITGGPDVEGGTTLTIKKGTDTYKFIRGIGPQGTFMNVQKNGIALQDPKDFLNVLYLR